MKNSIIKIFAVLSAMILMMFAMPQKAQAASNTFKQTIKVAIYDAKGNWKYSETFESKNLSATITSTYAGTYEWTWAPNGSEYTATGTFSTYSNASTNLLHPSDLWKYDSNKYTFAGGNRSLCAPSKVSYPESGWKTYCSGYSKTMNSTVPNKTDTFYYIFEEKAPEVTYTLNYNTKGGTPSIDAQTITNNTGSATFTISSTVPSKDGYKFLGWSATDGGAVAYNPGGSLTTSDENTTLYAVWQGLGKIAVSCTGLAEGESAMFQVTIDETVHYISVAAGETATVAGVPAGQYTVVPTTWSWTYTGLENKTVTVVENQTATCSFAAVKDGSITTKYGEESKSKK